MLRRTRPLWRGRFSSMLDLGGMAPSGPVKAVDTGKNNKVRTIALDFDLLIRSAEKAAAQAKAREQSPEPKAVTSTPNNDTFLAKATPDVGVVENIANLLNINLGGDNTKKKEEDDLSLLLHGTKQKKQSSHSSTAFASSASGSSRTQSNASLTKAPPVSDVRAKYADKLRKKVEGGIAGVDSANVSKAESIVKGDAAGHLEARRHAISSFTAPNSKWLLPSGSGAFMTFMTNRSMKVALLPLPGSTDTKSTQHDMEEFCEQLAGRVQVHVKIADGQQSVHNILTEVQENVQEQRPVQAGKDDSSSQKMSSILIVSDRDDYLREGRELGMFTCRVRPKNARRGNITAHYNVEQIAEVEEVVNEINGISFNAVFAGA